jgi:maleate isomerase
MKFDTNLGPRIGMLTPSANTCLEPVTCAIMSSMPEVSVHFSRFKVTYTALDAAALSQFELSNLLEAADLLADAQVDLIVWNGSSGSWMPGGRDIDQRLCEAIEESTGIRATTMTFAVWDAFRLMGVKRYTLVTPFGEDMANQIIANYEQEGFSCVRSVRLELPTTLEKDRVPREEMRRLIASAAGEDADGIAIVCTNFRGAPLVDEMERVLGLPIIDSVSATAWKALEMLALQPKIKGWGRLLRREFVSANLREG